MKIEIIESEQFGRSISHQAGDFRKWMKNHHPDVEVVLPSKKPKFDLHDHSLVMPLVSLATDTNLVNYLCLVVEYSNYYFRGNLDGDKNEVTLSVLYIDSKSGTEKSFNFKGPKEALKENIEKFDINGFMGDN